MSKPACSLKTGRPIGVRSPMLYGHFIEHFHRQIYGGVYDPAHPLADEDGLRTDVLAAMRRLKVPILRLPLTKHGGWRIPTPSARMNT